MKKKAFIITIDTERDNQWEKSIQAPTDNAYYIPRFQELCNKYNFKVVYLTDYAMANNEYFVSYIKEQEKSGNCEIGMHLHAWDTPPSNSIDTKTKYGKPYLYEYEQDIMREKLKRLDDILKRKITENIVSHRAGRWAMNQKYFFELANLGYSIDCSVTPLINWSEHIGAFQENGGSNYQNAPKSAHYIYDNILEVPVTIRNIKTYDNNLNKLCLKQIYYRFFGKKVWLRPSVASLDEMKKLIQVVQSENENYIEFMMHSSEFMPGGSPYYKNEEAIEILYGVLESLFEYLSEDYEGYTLQEYKKIFCTI